MCLCVIVTVVQRLRKWQTPYLLFDSRTRDEVIAQEVAKISDEWDFPRAQVALAWVMRNPVVASPIIGASKVGHVEDAAMAVEIDSTNEERERLEAHYTPMANLS